MRCGPRKQPAKGERAKEAIHHAQLEEVSGEIG